MTSSSDNGREAALARIAAVRARFVSGLDARLRDLGDLAREAGGSNVAAASGAWEKLRLGLHNLAGGAPTLGLDDLGDSAADIEAVVIESRRTDGRLDPETAEVVAGALEALRNRQAKG